MHITLYLLRDRMAELEFQDFHETKVQSVQRRDSLDGDDFQHADSDKVPDYYYYCIHYLLLSYTLCCMIT